MTIAVLGGSFDPPHIGHYWIANQVLELRKDIAKVLLVPVNKHQWKEISSSPKDRLNMLKLIATQNIEVSNIEIERDGISYTEDTLRELKKEYEKIYWIVGSDILNEYSKWDKRDEILNLATFLVFPRDECDLPETLPVGFELLSDSSLITTNISSTLIKDRIKKGLSISSFVTKGVEDYIREKKLYQ